VERVGKGSKWQEFSTLLGRKIDKIKWVWLAERGREEVDSWVEIQLE
jgi:hypothetical protein